ncbi:S-layer homology domain-containing protein [Bacillus testis]|uniref:S-layer homology domain-containing protein n=1 Tax=Bacillus testis TaxID=1622072 RepID=UPI00067F30BC|nr:S-layer homology domain-containing protein [Bacillus testis]
MRKLTSVFLSFILLLTLTPFAHAASYSASKEMQSMVKQGIITGYADGSLAPFAKVKRGEFATFLYRALSLPEGKQQFNDVAPKSALAAGINAAAAAGIVTGFTTTTFGPEQLITREQMAIMIDRALDYAHIAKKTATLSFLDNDDIKARAAVQSMVGHGIIAGYPTAGGFVFKPQEEATREHAAAFIYRMMEASNVEDLPGTPAPANPTAPTPTPTPANNRYVIATVDASGNTKPTGQSYQTLGEAASALSANSNYVVMLDNRIIKMNSGVAVAKTPKSGGATTLFKSDMKTVILGMQYGSELEYVTSDENAITVKAAGQLGYVKSSDAYLVPSAAMKGRSFYISDAQGNLKHTVYSNLTDSYASYIYGKAPSSFQTGVKYYSWDGVHFTNEQGVAVGTFNQYFNVLPYRTSTNYSAAEIDAIVLKRLKEKESLYKSNPKAYARYKDATKKSKLLGIGKTLKDYERYHKLNAMMVLAKGISESDYGMSPIAQSENNLFGLQVYDSGSKNRKKYKTPGDSIKELSESYLNKNYIPQTGNYANGGILGNKARGANVRYASDPYWGQKIAGHMYELDKEMGGKDFINNSSLYQLFETTGPATVYRAASSTSGNLYSYPGEGFIVAATGGEGGYRRILSDSREEAFGYLSAQQTRPLPIVK